MNWNFLERLYQTISIIITQSTPTNPPYDWIYLSSRPEGSGRKFDIYKARQVEKTFRASLVLQQWWIKWISTYIYIYITKFMFYLRWTQPIKHIETFNGHLANNYQANEKCSCILLPRKEKEIKHARKQFVNTKWRSE